jgi:hypothetical protein
MRVVWHLLDADLSRFEQQMNSCSFKQPQLQKLAASRVNCVMIKHIMVGIEFGWTMILGD